MGIKKNFAYNVVLTMSSYIISLIVFPYVARILGVGILGKIDFSNNVINIFSLLSLMGVSSVGIREIAASGNDRELRSQVFSSILGFILLLSILSLIIFFISIFNIPKFQSYRDLLIVGSFALFFTSLLIEWLYQGTEQFKYITQRTIFIRVLYAICIFLFIKDKDDYLLYYVLTVASTILNACINIIYSKKYVDFKLKYVSIFKYAKDIISLGTYKILTSMYTTFNVIFLGFVCNDIQVGYYSVSTKLFYILLGVLSAFTSVMLPRMSALISEDKQEEFKSKINISFDLVFMVTIPIIIWTIIYTPNIIQILSGSGYEGAISPMRIITPMLFITGIAQIFVIQILIPLKKDNIVLIGSIIGAVIGVLSNILFVKELGAIGTAITLLLSEICGDIVGLVYTIKHKIIIFPWKRMIKYLSFSIPYFLICYITLLFNLNYIWQLVYSIIICMLYFYILNKYIMKNAIFKGAIKSIKNKIK